MRDVARIEWAALDYTPTASFLLRQERGFVAKLVTKRSGSSNARGTAKNISDGWPKLKAKIFPKGSDYNIGYNQTEFIAVQSVSELIKTILRGN